MIASTRSVGGGAHFFSPQRIRQLRDRFRELDTSKQGRVLVKDFSELFQDVFGRQPMRDELPETSTASTDATNGTVSFDDILKSMSRVARTWQALDPTGEDGAKVEDTSKVDNGVGDAPDILESFKALQDESGGVSVSNLCLLMESAGLTLSEEDIVRMCQDVGAKQNEDGTIPYAGFVKLLLA